MSMQICVFSDRTLDSIAEWQQAIDAEGFRLRLSDDVPPSEIGGIWLGQLHDELTNFEFHARDAQEMMEGYGTEKFDRKWKYAFAFIWGGLNVNNSTAAWMAAVAYARATGGVIYDDEEGKLFSPAAALDVARDLEQFLPELRERKLRLMQRLATRREQT
jgi:hypothetical protein